MNIKLLICFLFIVNLIQCIAIEISSRIEEIFKGIREEDGVAHIQGKDGNKHVKVLLKMKKNNGNNTNSVKDLTADSYVNIERLGIFATHVSYDEAMALKDDIEMIEPDGDVYDINDENQLKNIKNHRKRQNERRLTEKVTWNIKEILQDVKFWESTVPKMEMKICVVDTGYDLGHDDLPVKPDVIGKNTPNITENWSYDGHGHGSHVAGIISAIGGNKKGVRGVFPNNKEGKFQLLIGKAFNKTGKTSESKVLYAVENCVSNGANIINLSVGNYNAYNISREYYQELYYNQGILIFGAAGNEGTDVYRYPASYPSVISVGAMTKDYSHAGFSNINDQVELSAPGENIKSTTRKNSYDRSTGTSMAVPHISAIAGLLWMHFPQCTNHQIRNVLADTAMNIGKKPVCDKKTGFGFVQSVDAYKRLELGDCDRYKARSSNPGGGCYLDSSKPNYRTSLRQKIRKRQNGKGI